MENTDQTWQEINWAYDNIYADDSKPESRARQILRFVVAEIWVAAWFFLKVLIADAVIWFVYQAIR